MSWIDSGYYEEDAWSQPAPQQEGGWSSTLSNVLSGWADMGKAKEQQWNEWNRSYGLPDLDIAETVRSMSPAGITKIVGSGPSKMIQAFSNQNPSVKVGQLGYRDMPNIKSLQDIKVDPAYRGQGYADEMLNTFFNQAGNQARFGGTITNSVPFWERLTGKYSQDYPQFTKGLNQALEWARGL